MISILKIAIHKFNNKEIISKKLNTIEKINKNNNNNNNKINSCSFNNGDCYVVFQSIFIF